MQDLYIIGLLKFSSPHQMENREKKSWSPTCLLIILSQMKTDAILNCSAWKTTSVLHNFLTKKLNTCTHTCSLIYDGLTYNFSSLWWVQKWYTFSRNHTTNFEFWSFSRLVIYCMILTLSCDAGQQQWER